MSVPVAGEAGAAGAQAVHAYVRAARVPDGRPLDDGSGWLLDMGVRYKRTMLTLTLVMAGFLVVTLGGAWFADSRGHAVALLLFALGFWGTFLAVCAGSLFSAHRAVIVLTEDGLRVESAFGSRQSMSFGELDRLTWSYVWDVVRLHASDGRRIALALDRNGLGRLRALIETRAQHVLDAGRRPPAQVQRTWVALAQLPILPDTLPAELRPAAIEASRRQEDAARSGLSHALHTLSVLGLWLLLMLVAGPRGWQPLEWTGPLVAAGIGLVAGALVTRLAVRRPHLVWIPVCTLVGVLLALTANGLGDSSTAVLRTCRVVGVSRSSIPFGFSQLRVESWRPGEDEVSLWVFTPFRATQAGDEVRITTRAGRLGWEWVQSVERVPR